MEPARSAAADKEGMPRSPTFDQIWLPRLGVTATAELRRNGYLTLIGGPAVLVLAVASSFGFGSGRPIGLATGLLCVTGALIVFAAWIRSRRRLANALSRRFGVKIGWWEMPNMRGGQFDAWCARRKMNASASVSDV
jgi:hypothetical protein